MHVISWLKSLIINEKLIQASWFIDLCDNGEKIEALTREGLAKGSWQNIAIVIV
jgi:hypothetical protein